LKTTIATQLISVFFIATAVASCGGGGGTSSTTPNISNQPTAKSVLVGRSAKFEVGVQSETASTFEWRLSNQTLVDGVLSTGPCTGANVNGSKTDTLLLTSISLGCDQASLSVQIGNTSGSTVSQPAVLSVMGYSKQALSTASFTNGSATFSVDGNFPSSAVYQWQIGGTNLVDGTMGLGVCAGTTVSGSSTKELLLSNLPISCNAASINASVAVDGDSLVSQPANLAISEIRMQPSQTSILVGGNASFNISTAGASNLQYAWAINGAPLNNGAIPSGVCAGTVVTGAASGLLQLQAPPVSCDGALFTVKLTNSANGSISSGSATLNVSGSSSQPLPVSITQGNTAQFSYPLAGTPLPTSVAWRLNGNNLSDGFQASGLCAGATISGATSSLLTLVNTPISCSGAVFSAVTNGAGGTVTSSNATLKVAAGDPKNGTYKSFATDGKTYDIAVNFDANTFKVSDASGVISSGALAQDLSPVGTTELGSFRMSDPAVFFSSAGGFKYKNDVLVGVHLPFGGGFGTAPIPFVAARKFVRASSELVGNVDFKVLGKDITSAGTGGYAADSNITTSRLSSSGLDVCAGGALVDVVNCGTGGSSLLSYGLTYNADGSVTFINQANATDTGNAYIAKMGSELLYLRASTRNTGLPSFRLGIQSTAAQNISIVAGDSRSYWGPIVADASTLSFSGANLVLAGPATSRTSSNRITVIPSGLYSYGDSTNGIYFSAQSNGLFVSAGARDVTLPLVNGRMTIGLIP
jgi:hypothetical protein